MNRFIALAVLALSSRAAIAADKNQLDGNPALFSVMAALNAVGFDADAASAVNRRAGYTAKA